MNDIIKSSLVSHALSSNKYMIFVEKDCGYNWLIIIHKKITLNELYRHIEIDMELFEGFKLYTTNGTLIPRSLERINDYVIKNQNEFTPEFNLPDPVVYIIKIDYFHNHS